MACLLSINVSAQLSFQLFALLEFFFHLIEIRNLFSGKLSVGSNTDTTSGYPFTTMKNNHLNDNSFVTFHGDPNDVTPDYQHGEM